MHTDIHSHPRSLASEHYRKRETNGMARFQELRARLEASGLTADQIANRAHDPAANQPRRGQG